MAKPHNFDLDPKSGFLLLYQKGGDEYERLTLKMISGQNVKSYEIQWNLKLAQSVTIFHFVEDIGMPFGIIGKILGLIGQRTADKMVEGMLVKLKNLSEG
ncbi:MAG: hypothetical protein B6I22_13055 [Desulfobacteraceae bacterium 4572_123]|nr:MAG: hypothetical protein B6I22_13055 [Desulfobacteraceae bacterium 4572_123]